MWGGVSAGGGSDYGGGGARKRRRGGAVGEEGRGAAGGGRDGKNCDTVLICHYERSPVTASFLISC